MSIPINNALVQGAVTYTAPFSSIAMNVCAAPAEGAKCIPLQFLFNVTAAWTVSMNGGIPTVSQISSMYIDVTQSATSVIVIFPDTGYSVTVNAGKSLLCPVFTGKGQLPQFYVVLNSGGTTTNDIVNIILLNFFIPEFAAP